jgi:hypothetical protein
MKHGQVVFGLFSPANEQVPKAVEPGVGPFHNPAPGFLARFFGLDFFPTRANVGRVAQVGQQFAHLFRGVAGIQAQPLLPAIRPVGLSGRFGQGWHARQGALHQLHVVAVGPVKHQPHRDAPGLRQQTALDAAFGAVRGVGPGFFFRPAALCAASRRAPSTRNSTQSGRRSHPGPRPRAGQIRRLAPTAGTGCGRYYLYTNLLHPALSTESPCARQRKWRSVRLGPGCAADGSPAGGPSAHARAIRALTAPKACLKS